MFLAGTRAGLFEIDGDGTSRLVGNGGSGGNGGGGGAVTALSGAWMVVDGAVEGFDLPQPAECIADLGERPLVGTAEARLFLGDEPVDSFDRIPTRSDWYTPWGALPDTRSLAVSGDAGWLVNVHVGGVWRSDDAGAEWTEVVDVDSDTHQVLASGRTVVAAAAVGFGQSDDGGATWAWTADGLHASYCRAVAFAGDTVLVSASTGPFTKQAAVYRRPLRAAGTRGFERCTVGLPDWFGTNVDTFQLAADDAVAVLGTSDGTLWASHDEGASWSQVVTGLPPIHCLAVR